MSGLRRVSAAVVVLPFGEEFHKLHFLLQ
jgi:hypothetical protein